MKLFALSLICALSLAAQGTSLSGPQTPALPKREPLEVPARIGIYGETKLTLPAVIERVIANDRDLALAEVAQREAVLTIRGAKGYYDPSIGMNAYRQRVVSPVASVLGGSADGKLTQKELYADPQISGLTPFLGGSYKLDFASTRLSSDNTFNSLNPQFPTSATLNYTQPLWGGLLYDANRHRLQVARRNQRLTDEQFRQRVIEVTTQAIQDYWEVLFAYRNLAVQIEAVRLAEQQDASNRREVEQGLLAPADVIQTQTQIATFQQNVFTAQDTLTRAENNLKALMTPDRTDILWGVALIPDTPPHPEGELPTLGEALKAALAGRPELRESDINIDINRLDSRLSRELAKPQVNAVAIAGVQSLSGRVVAAGPNPLTEGFEPLIERLTLLSSMAGLPAIPPLFSSSTALPGFLVGGYDQSLSNLRNGTFPTVQAGVQMTIPIRNRTAEANAATSVLEGKRLGIQRQQLAMAVEADVRNALQTLGSSQARYGAAMLARRSAEDQYASEQRQFQAGTSSVFLVLQRQNDLISARSREARAEADLGEAAADFDRATARTIRARGIDLGR